MEILHFMRKMSIYLREGGHLLNLDGKIYQYIHPTSWQGMTRGNDHQGHGHSGRMPLSPTNLKKGCPPIYHLAKDCLSMIYAPVSQNICFRWIRSDGDPPTYEEGVYLSVGRWSPFDLDGEVYIYPISWQGITNHIPI